MIKDRTFPSKPDYVSSGVIGLASPKDRLAAFILDVAILIPIIQLLQAPFKKSIIEAVLYNASDGASVYRVLNLVVVFAVLIIYQTLMTYWKGQSLGKMFFHLRVISYQGHLTLYQSFLRALFFVIEFFSFGWMWTALFSHPMRRVFHDRIADTLVISTKNPIGLPTQKEVFSSRLINGFFSFTILIFVGSLFLNSHKEVESIEAIVFGDDSCSEMKAKLKENVEDLTIAHLERKISSKCLYEFARKNIWDEKDKENSHFAMALALKNSPVESKRYLDETCRLEGKSSLCTLGQWLEKRNKNKNVSALDLYESVKGKNHSKIVPLVLSLFLQKDNEHQKSLEVLASIKRDKAAENLKVALTFQSLLSLKKFNEAFWIFKTHKVLGGSHLKQFYSNYEGANKFEIGKHVKFLEKLFPNLTKTRDGRGLASTAKETKAIRQLYEDLRGQL